MNQSTFTIFKTIALALILTISASKSFAQTTNGIFFQAVARDNFSNPAKDRKIFVQTSVIQSTTSGTIVLTEEHQATTDATGVFNISIGNGLRVGGTAANLSSIDWSKGPFFLNLKISITPIGSNSSWDYTKEWIDMGTTSFGAVPFAYYAAQVAGFDTKLNVSDTAKMLLPYAKTTAVNTLSTNVDTKLATKFNLSDTINYTKKTFTDSAFGKKMNIADSTNGYVTPTQLAAKTFDQTPITNAIATKLNIADSTNGYVTPTMLAAKTFDQTPITNAIATKLNIADSTNGYVTPTMLAAKTFDQTPITNAIATKLNIADTISLSNRINLKASNADLTSITNTVTANTASITSNANAITAEVTRATAAELALTNNVASNTASITSNATAITAEATRATAAELVLTNNVASNAASITAGLALKLDASQKGASNGVASLNAFGIIPSSQLPPVTLSSTNVVASDAAMIALSSATVGSIAIRTDVNKNYVLSALPASTLGNWIELLTPAAPVQTVNGYTGAVNLTKTDFDLGNVNNTSDANKPISTDVQNALNLKANITDVNTGLAQKMNTTDVNAALALKSNATEVNTALASKISTADATAALNLKLDANKVGVASGVASLNALGKVPTDQIPAISFSSVKVLASEAEMLALSSAVIGSVVIRTDESKNYVLAQSNPAVRANWIQLLTPAAPVQTVNGMTGDISITKSSIGLDNVQNTTDASKPISTLTQNALDTKVDKVTGKVLSTNDYTTAEKTKLAAITGTNTGDQDLSAYATTSALAAKAPLASPNFTGTVSAGVISATSITAPTYASAPKTLTYSGSTINWNPAQGLNAAITLTQNSSLSFTGAPPVGSYGTVVLTQDATGTRTITLPTITGVTNKVLGSTSTSTVALSTVANAKDILNFYYDGTICYWNIGQGYGLASSSSNSGSTNFANGVTGTLSVANGGTGVTSLTGLVKADGANAFTAAVAGTDYQRPIILTTTGSGSATLSGTTLNIPSVSSTVNAGSISGTVAVLNGGTGATTQQAAINLLTGTQSSGKYLRSDGANATLSAIQAADIPTLNQNTTGNATTATTAGNITATSNTTLTSLSNLATVGAITTGTWSATTIEVAKGGTGATSANAAFNALAPAQTSNSGKYLTTDGTNTSWGTVASTLPTTVNTSANYNIVMATGSNASLVTGTGNGGNVATLNPYTGKMSVSGLTAYGYGITSPIYASTPQVLTDASTISWDPINGLNASVTLAGNRTLSFSTPPTSGAYGTLVVKQDATGGRTLTLPSVTNKILGSTSTTSIGLSTAANAIDIINFYFDGTNYFWNVGQGYGTAASLTASNIAGGAAGSIPYQTAAGATSLLAKGTDGQILTLASGIPSWSAAPATGVTSFAMTTPTGLSVSGSPITSSGTLALSLTSGYAIPLTSSQTNWDAAYTNRITSVSSPLSISSNALSLGTVPVSSGGTGATTLNGLIKGNGTNAMTVASAGTDYQAPIVLTTTGTGAATLSGTTLNIPSVSTVRMNSDEFTATAAQTVFTFTTSSSNTGAVQTPTSKPFMYINGTRIKNSAFTWTSGTSVTYIPANNNSYALVAGDRVQFDYAY